MSQAQHLIHRRQVFRSPRQAIQIEDPLDMAPFWTMRIHQFEPRKGQPQPSFLHPPSKNFLANVRDNSKHQEYVSFQRILKL